MNIELQNRSNSEMTLNGHKIKPHKSLIVSYQTFIDIVIAEDLTSKNDIVIIKERDVPSEISVSEFGARGDGWAEDTYSFQKAADFLKMNGGGVMHIPAGIYPISEVLFSAPIQINGAGSKNTIIKSMKDEAVLFNFDDCGDCAISNLKIKKVARGSEVGNNGTAIKIKSSSNKEQQLSLFNVLCESNQFEKIIDIDSKSHIVGGFSNEK